jgi:hypothetical protein
MSETKLEWTELASMVKVAAEPDRVELFHCLRPAETLMSKGVAQNQPERIYTVYSDGSATSELADGTVLKLRLPEGTSPQTREAELRKKYYAWRFEIEHFPTPEEVVELDAQASMAIRQKRFDRYIREAQTTLMTGVSEHGIKKSVWTAAKEAVSRAIDLVWEYEGFNAHNFVKKYSAIPSPTPVQQEAYEAIAPLCVRLAELKDQVYTGRAPDAAPTQKELRLRRSDVGHCGICGRDIMLGNNHRISHHGYRVPHTGRTRSCFGTGYEPIETGTASLVAYQKDLEGLEQRLPAQIEKLQEWLQQNPRPVPPQGLDREALHQWKVQNHSTMERITSNVNMVASLQSDLKRIPQTISDVQAMIDSWEAGQTTTIEHFV